MAITLVPIEAPPPVLSEVEGLTKMLLRLHKPRNTSGGVRCTECAVNSSNGLKRASWPCKTARLLGVKG